MTQSTLFHCYNFLERNPTLNLDLPHTVYFMVRVWRGVLLLFRSTLPPSSRQNMRQQVKELPHQRAKLYRRFNCGEKLYVISEYQSSCGNSEVPCFTQFRVSTTELTCPAHVLVRPFWWDTATPTETTCLAAVQLRCSGFEGHLQITGLGIYILHIWGVEGAKVKLRAMDGGEKYRVSE